MMIICLITACQSTAPPADDTQGGDNNNDNVTNGGGSDVDYNQDILDATDLDAWIAAVVSRPADYAAPSVTYSSDLIEQAYASGEITEDECYILLTTAAYDHENLDDRFRAEKDPAPDSTSLLRRLTARYESLSLEAQAALRPFMLSFEDPDSFWYDPDEPKASEVISTSKTSIAARNMERPAAGGEYFLVTGGIEALREAVTEALYYAYDKFADLGFPEPTDWIRVSLRPDLSSLGFAGDEDFRELAGHVRCHIRLDADLGADELRTTAAHELFHCFQEYVEATPAVFAAPWVWESSAVWAEEFVYPDGNTEHEWDDTGFRHLNRYFFDTEGTREYASYLYWFFLYQRDGKTGNVARDLYQTIQSNGTLETITQRPSFYEEFKLYALWNLNTSPYKYYQDAAGAPTLRPSGESILHSRIEAGEMFYESIEVAEGAMMYYVYTFADLVDKVKFDLRNLQKDESNENGVQIVYRIGGTWNYDDVSYRDEVTFCRSREAEDVDAIIFVISNGNLDQSAADSAISTELIIDATEWCEASWHGYVECSWSTSGEGDGREDFWLLGNYTSQGTKRVDETLLYDDEHDRFYAIEQTVSISSRYEWFYEHEVPTVDTSYTAWEQRVEDKAATRTNVYEPGPDCPPDECWGIPIRIDGLEDGDDTTYMLGDQVLREVGTYLSIYSAYYVPGSLGIMQGHVAEVRTSEDEHSIVLSCPSDPIELTMSADGLRLTGTYQDENMSCQAEYSYD